MPDREPVIFVSYRGEAGDWGPDFVYEKLAEAFGAEVVFKAGQTLRPGQEFTPVLEARAASCRVMLVCIGPGWLTAQNRNGARRLDDPHDWVRREIRLALENGNHVIPLLLGNLNEVSLPGEGDLPRDIAPLLGRQAVRLERGGRQRSLIPDLIKQLTALAPDLAERRSNAPDGLISLDIQVGTAGGSLTAVRTSARSPQRIDATMKIDEIATTGEVTGVNLLP
ncbi:MAG TPA: toll/interleukin-1 receptor domain-containing protein [Actinospica sp.]|jgi:hypothetical protein|nr:toll/interleukin-1 receptor domain-containing protein [Actinospica sp.]